MPFSLLCDGETKPLVPVTNAAARKVERNIGRCIVCQLDLYADGTVVKWKSNAGIRLLRAADDDEHADDCA